MRIHENETIEDELDEEEDEEPGPEEIRIR